MRFRLLATVASMEYLPMPFKVRAIIPLLAFFVSALVHADITQCYNFEYGLGYRDSSGRYMLHGSGVYVTYAAGKVPSGWNYAFRGQETVLSGDKNTTTLTPYFGVTYINSFNLDSNVSRLEDSQNGSPYDGSVYGPYTSNDGILEDSGRTPANGPLTNFIQIPPPDANSPQDFSPLNLNNWYFSDLDDGNGRWDGSGLFHIVLDGDTYKLYNENGDLISSWNSSDGPYAPITYRDPQTGLLVHGWYNPTNGQITTERPSDSSSSGTNTVINLQPVLTRLDTVTSNQDSLRNYLISAIGAVGGNSWIYDCKLSLSELESLATSLNVDVAAIRGRVYNISSHTANLSGMDSKLGSINTTLSGVSSAVTDIKNNSSDIKSAVVTAAQNSDIIASVSAGMSRDVSTMQGDLHSMLSRLNDVYSKLSDFYDSENNTNYQIPLLPQPDFSNEPSADDELPFKFQGWEKYAENTTKTLVRWGTSPSELFGLHDVFSDFLTRFVGNIPSVGSDPHMFDIDFDLPVIGHIQKSFNFSDFPAISVFRTVCLWILYVFFGLACFKLIHASII